MKFVCTNRKKFTKFYKIYKILQNLSVHKKNHVSAGNAMVELAVTGAVDTVKNQNKRIQNSPSTSNKDRRVRMSKNNLNK
jgi:hypothetical protein